MELTDEAIIFWGYLNNWAGGGSKAKFRMAEAEATWAPQHCTA